MIGGGSLRVIGFITEQKVIRKILDHLDKRNGDSRAPPIHQHLPTITPTFSRYPATTRYSFVFTSPHNSILSSFLGLRFFTDL